MLTRLKGTGGVRGIDEQTPQPSRQCSRNQCPHDSSCPAQETAVDATAPHTEIGILQPNVHSVTTWRLTAQCTSTLGISLPSAFLSLVIVSLPRENTSSRVTSWYVVNINTRGSNRLYFRARDGLFYRAGGDRARRPGRAGGRGGCADQSCREESARAAARARARTRDPL